MGLTKPADEARLDAYHKDLANLVAAYDDLGPGLLAQALIGCLAYLCKCTQQGGDSMALKLIGELTSEREDVFAQRLERDEALRGAGVKVRCRCDACEAGQGHS